MEACGDEPPLLGGDMEEAENTVKPGAAAYTVALSGLAARTVAQLAGTSPAVSIGFQLAATIIMLNIVLSAGRGEARHIYPVAALQAGLLAEAIAEEAAGRGILAHAGLGLIYSAILLPAVTGGYTVHAGSGLGGSEARALLAAAPFYAAAAAYPLYNGSPGLDLFYMVLAPIAEYVLLAAAQATLSPRIAWGAAAAASLLIPGPRLFYTLLSLAGTIYKLAAPDTARTLPVDYAARALIIMGGMLVS